MELKLPSKLYRAMRVQLIEYDDGVIVKRGALETHIRGERATELLCRVLEGARDGVTLEGLRDSFAVSDRADVDFLIDKLIARRLLVPIEKGQPAPDESAEGIFYWEFDQDATAVRARLKDLRLVIVGVTEISHELSRVMREAGFESCQVVDHPPLRNLRLFRSDGTVDPARWREPAPLEFTSWTKSADDSLRCLIATSDHGGHQWMRHWNEMCLANRLDFFPVVLKSIVGQIGPYVVPGETACYECVRARQNSHLSNPEAERASELFAFDTQSVACYHAAMPGAIAHVAAMELLKVLSGALPFRRVASLLELNLVLPKLVTHRVLRIPNCSVCLKLFSNSATSIDKSGGALPLNRQ